MSVLAKLRSGKRSSSSLPGFFSGAPFFAATGLGSGSPAGFAGSKKPVGLGSEATRRRLLIAWPAS